MFFLVRGQVSVTLEGLQSCLAGVIAKHLSLDKTCYHVSGLEPFEC